MILEDEIEALKLENVSLRERVLKVEGAQKVLNTRILAALNAPLSQRNHQNVIEVVEPHTRALA